MRAAIATGRRMVVSECGDPGDQRDMSPGRRAPRPAELGIFRGCGCDWERDSTRGVVEPEEPTASLTLSSGTCTIAHVTRAIASASVVSLISRG